MTCKLDIYDYPLTLDQEMVDIIKSLTPKFKNKYVKIFVNELMYPCYLMRKQVFLNHFARKFIHIIQSVRTLNVLKTSKGNVEALTTCKTC